MDSQGIPAESDYICKKKHMLVLIAESKTMTACDHTVAEGCLRAHTPVLGAEADSVMNSLRGESDESLARMVKISLPMAARLCRMIYDFPVKSSGAQAMEAYTGVVFKAFGYGTLPADARADACRRIRIVSSLYGWLRPDDIVKPYRFDFTTKLAPGGVSFASYWRERVTSCLLRCLREHGHESVLNLLPADASRCIDWPKVAECAGLFRADFREVRAGGELRTPDATRLKVLRGRLLRQIVEEGIDRADTLLRAESCYYVADGCDDAGNIRFMTAD